MDTTILFVIAGGIIIAILGILFLRIGKKLALWLLGIGGLAVVGTMALGFLAQAKANKAIAETAKIQATSQAATSAANSVIIFLLVVLLFIFVLAVIGVAGLFLYSRYQSNRKFQTQLQQAQLYAALQGIAPRPQMSYRPVPQPQPQQQNPSIIVIGGGQQQPQQPYPPQVVYVQQPEENKSPFAGFLPFLD
jgi:hypothetical protein